MTQGWKTAQGRATIRLDEAMTRPAIGCDTAQCVSRLGSGCALGAPNPVLTQCTVLSHSFGPLFMNTVHKIFQKKKK